MSSSSSTKNMSYPMTEEKNRATCVPSEIILSNRSRTISKLRTPTIEMFSPSSNSSSVTTCCSRCCNQGLMLSRKVTLTKLKRLKPEWLSTKMITWPSSCAHSGPSSCSRMISTRQIFWLTSSRSLWKLRQRMVKCQPNTPLKSSARLTLPILCGRAWASLHIAAKWPVVQYSF